MISTDTEISDRVDAAERKVHVLDTPEHLALLKNIGFGVLKKVTLGSPGALRGLANQYVVVRFADHNGDVQLLFEKMVYADGKKNVRYAREERHPGDVQHLARLTTTSEHPFLNSLDRVTIYQVMRERL